MKPYLLVVLLLVVNPVIPGAPVDQSQEDLRKWAKSLDKAVIHRSVVAAEGDVLGEPGEMMRPVLAVYCEDVKYITCLDLCGFLADTKKPEHMAILLHMSFASCDYVVQHPEQANDRYAYMLAGVESGLHAYRNALLKHPAVRHERLDALLQMQGKGQLGAYVKARTCEGK